KAAKLITRKMIQRMQKGCVLVDVCIDQGGISETSRPTTHSNPTYFVDGVLHYCVTNMPGAFGRTATTAYTNAILPYALKAARGSLRDSFKEDPGLAQGLNVFKGQVTYRAVADSLNLSYMPWEKLV